MDVIYRAYDGKEFDSEEECEAYETISTIPKERRGFKVYNRYGEQVPLLNEDNLVYDEFYYIKTHSAEEAETLHKILRTAGLISPWDKQGCQNAFEHDAGCYYYDCDDYEWKDFKEFEQTYETMRNIFKDDE